MALIPNWFFFFWSEKISCGAGIEPGWLCLWSCATCLFGHPFISDSFLFIQTSSVSFYVCDSSLFIRLYLTHSLSCLLFVILLCTSLSLFVLYSVRLQKCVIPQRFWGQPFTWLKADSNSHLDTTTWKDCREAYYALSSSSVTRLASFWNFWVTHFVAKDAQLFNDFLGYFEKITCSEKAVVATFDQLLRNLDYFFPTSGHTVLLFLIEQTAIRTFQTLLKFNDNDDDNNNSQIR